MLSVAAQFVNVVVNVAEPAVTEEYALVVTLNVHVYVVNEVAPWLLKAKFHEALIQQAVYCQAELFCQAAAVSTVV